MSCCDDKTPKEQQKTGLMGLLTGPRRWMLLGAVVVAGGLPWAGINWSCWGSLLSW